MTSDKITPEEQARRRYAVEQANAHNLIEGIMPNPAADAIYERWIAGDIDSDEVTRLIGALARMKARAWEAPADYRLDRDEANENG